MVLNLGAGQKLLPDSVNVDKVALPGIDVVHDVDVYPWPWPDQSFAEVYVTHLFEHVVDPLAFMAEAWRILHPGGLLAIEVPHYTNRNAFTDPTHRRFCTEDTFRYWVPGTWLYDMGGVAYHRDCLFDEISNEVVAGDLRVTLRRRV